MIQTAIAGSLVTLPFAIALVVFNGTSVTDFGTTTTISNQTKDTLTTSANFTTDEMVETSCHIISEQLVATATATVSSAFDDLCRTESMTTQLIKIEDKLFKKMDSVEEKVNKILNHFMITQKDAKTENE